MGRHQCDYCPWYYRGCEAPFQMRASSCERAIRKKHEEEKYDKLRSLSNAQR